MSKHSTMQYSHHDLLNGSTSSYLLLNLGHPGLQVTQLTPLLLHSVFKLQTVDNTIKTGYWQAVRGTS